LDVPFELVNRMSSASAWARAFRSVSVTLTRNAKLLTPPVPTFVRSTVIALRYAKAVSPYQATAPTPPPGAARDRNCRFDVLVSSPTV
jgi:hypothetical protein